MATRTRDSLKLPTSNRAYLIKIDVGPGNRNLILPKFAAAQEILASRSSEIAIDGFLTPPGSGQPQQHSLLVLWPGCDLADAFVHLFLSCCFC